METVKVVLTVIYVVAALAIILVVLLQEGKSAGLGSLGGGTNASNSSYWDKNKKHSLEGKLERWIKMTAALFVILALILMMIN